jgi:Fimbrial assembly protein (PilN)
MTLGLRQWLAFGTGAGIQAGGRDLEIAVARVRPTGIHVLGRTTIARFRERPAAEWGAEYSDFMKKLGASHVSATVILPRDETIVRQMAFKGVEAKDLEAAIAFQLDAVNPYGDEEVRFGWNALGDGAVLVGIVRSETLERYLELFTEAGIATASFTFGAAAIHAAIRLGPPPPAAFMALSRSEAGTVEVYGESPARAVFSAEFDLPAERAAALAAAELRLEPDVEPVELASVLPAPKVNPVENDLARDAMPYAAALAGACPHLAAAANLLPAERRVASSRGMFIPTAALAALVLMMAGASLGWSGFKERQYLKELHSQIARLQPQAQRAAALSGQIERARSRARLLDEFRSRTRRDLETLNALSRLLAPPVWSKQMDIAPDAVVIDGEAEQAAPLLKVLDASPLFHNSEFNSISKVGKVEVFRLRTQRKAQP